MWLGDNCSTAISDLKEGQCSNSVAQTHNCSYSKTCSSTGAIVGGATAVIIVLVVSLAVVVVIALITRNRCGNISLKTAER